MRISQAAFDLIVQEETGGEAYYRKTEQSTDWPGGASGVTIGCGYDCGYAAAADVGADWGGKLPAPMVTALESVAGIHGSAASSHAHELKSVIDVPWAVALDVFRNRDVPKWESTVSHALANTDLLSGDSFGALVSLAFNRGASFSVPADHDPTGRYAEMRDIADLMRAKQFAEIPGAIRAMKRLWPATQDLRDRRDHEAALFEQGLRPNAPRVAPAPPIAPPIARAEPPLWLRLFDALTRPIGGGP